MCVLHFGCVACKHVLPAVGFMKVEEVRNGIHLPASPAGILLPHSTTEEAPSLPAMSVQEDNTDQLALAPREGEATIPLTKRSLALLGTDDPRRRMLGANSEWDYLITPSPAFAPLAGHSTQSEVHQNEVHRVKCIESSA